MYLRPLAGLALGTVAAVLVIAIIPEGRVFRGNESKVTASSTPRADASRASGEPLQQTETLASIRAGGGSAVCSLYRAEGATKLSGTLTISGDRYRADIQVAKAGNSLSFELHTLRVGGHDYSWTNLVPQGTKMVAVDEPQFSLFRTECREAEVSELLFVIPLDITFD